MRHFVHASVLAVTLVLSACGAASSDTQQLLSDGTADWCRAFANEANATGAKK
jgi:hypothetical protein